jgi:hypothetical protein
MGVTISAWTAVSWSAGRMNYEKAGADLGALRRRARPGLLDHDVGGFEPLGEGWSGACHEQIAKAGI